MEEAKITVTLDTEQFELAICKANELIDTINKAKSLTKDLASMVGKLDYNPQINVKQGYES